MSLVVRSRLAFALAFALRCAIAAAHADDSVNVQTFSPTANPRYLLNESAVREQPAEFMFSASYNYLRDPLVELDPSRQKRLSTLVDGIQTLDLLLAKELGRVTPAVAIPLHLVQLAGQSNQGALGDARLLLKTRLNGDGAPVSFSVIPELRLPTGSSDLFVSDGGMGYGASIAAERNFRVLSVVGNIGYRRSTGARFRDINYRSRAPIGAGAYVPIAARWGADVEGHTDVILPLNSYQNPSELYLGARYLPASDVAVLAGVAIGSIADRQASDAYRVIAGVRYSPYQTPPRVEREIRTQAAAPTQPHEPSAPMLLSGGRLTINKEIRFKHDSAELLPNARALLDDVAAVIVATQRSRPGETPVMDIEGHTNELGSDAYNLGLSQRRAESVQARLLSRGVHAELLHAVGYGERRPKIAASDTRYSRAIRLSVNRRVDFKLAEPPELAPNQQAGRASPESNETIEATDTIVTGPDVAPVPGEPTD